MPGAVQRFDIHIHSLGSCWWLDRHEQTNHLVMDAINATSIGVGSRKKRLWTKVGFVRARLSVLSSFGHQDDIAAQTFVGCLIEKVDGTANLRLEKRLKRTVVGERLLLCTKSTEHGCVNEAATTQEPGAFLLSAAGTKSDREHLWVCASDTLIHFAEYKLRVLAQNHGWKLVREG